MQCSYWLVAVDVDILSCCDRSWLSCISLKPRVVLHHVVDVDVVVFCVFLEVLISFLEVTVRSLMPILSEISPAQGLKITGAASHPALLHLCQI